jgi:hypothetical protein
VIPDGRVFYVWNFDWMKNLGNTNLVGYVIASRGVVLTTRICNGMFELGVYLDLRGESMNRREIFIVD